MGPYYFKIALAVVAAGVTYYGLNHKCDGWTIAGVLLFIVVLALAITGH